MRRCQGRDTGIAWKYDELLQVWGEHERRMLLSSRNQVCLGGYSSRSSLAWDQRERGKQIAGLRLLSWLEVSVLAFQAVEYWLVRRGIDESVSKDVLDDEQEA
jgi:hypothetical protein